MTITITKRVIQQSGNGSTTVWPYDFYIGEASEVEVSLYTTATGVTEVLSPSVYSITGLGEATFGSVTYPLSGPPIPAGVDILITRTVPYTQTLDISSQGAYDPQVLEDALDRIVMQTQQLQEQVDRAVKVNIASGTSPDDIIDDLNTTAAASAASAAAAAIAETGAEAALAATLAAGTNIIAVDATGVAGTADAITLTNTNLPPAVSGLTKIRFVPKANNTGAVTVTVSDGTTPWAAKALVAVDGDALGADALIDDVPCEIVYSAELDKFVLLGFGNYAQLAEKQAWTKPQRAGSEAVAYATPYTPDLSAAPYKDVAALTGPFDIDPPINCVVGDLFTIEIVQDGTGSRAVTMDAAYINQPDAFVQTAGNRHWLDCMVTAVSGTTATEVLILGSINEDNL